VIRYVRWIIHEHRGAECQEQISGAPWHIAQAQALAEGASRWIRVCGGIDAFQLFRRAQHLGPGVTGGSQPGFIQVHLLGFRLAEKHVVRAQTLRHRTIEGPAPGSDIQPFGRNTLGLKTFGEIAAAVIGREDHPGARGPRPQAREEGAESLIQAPDLIPHLGSLVAPKSWPM